MTVNGYLQIVLFVGVLLLLVKPLGWYMARVYQGQPVLLERVLRPFERLIYRALGTHPEREMTWKTYALAMLAANALGLFVVYLLLRGQGGLPLNPQEFAGAEPHTALNIAISFASNTNWQNYGSESTLSYLTQMLGLTTQNFLSAATGMAVLVALIRGLSRRSAATIGNFWVDLIRSVIYILLPLAIILSLVEVSQGVVQNFDDYQEAALDELDREE
jgi:K+-transporting ATPase ATPase A chain